MPPLLVTAAIVRHAGRVLITRRPETARHGGLWEFPGGKVEAGESPPEALKRELAEELDLAIAVGPLFEVVHYRYDWGAVLILAYECTPLHLRLRCLEVAEFRWALPGELDRFEILPADRPLISALQQQEKPFRLVPFL